MAWRVDRKKGKLPVEYMTSRAFGGFPMRDVTANPAKESNRDGRRAAEASIAAGSQLLSSILATTPLLHKHFFVRALQRHIATLPTFAAGTDA